MTSIRRTLVGITNHFFEAILSGIDHSTTITKESQFLVNHSLTDIIPKW